MRLYTIDRQVEERRTSMPQMPVYPYKPAPKTKPSLNSKKKESDRPSYLRKERRLKMVTNTITPNYSTKADVIAFSDKLFKIWKLPRHSIPEIRQVLKKEYPLVDYAN